MRIKISITILLFILQTSCLYGQEKKQLLEDSINFDLGESMKEIFNTKVDLEVDKELFNKQMGNIYLSEEYNAVLMILVVPQSIETAAGHHGE